MISFSSMTSFGKIRQYHLIFSGNDLTSVWFKGTFDQLKWDDWLRFYDLELWIHS